MKLGVPPATPPPPSSGAQAEGSAAAISFDSRTVKCIVILAALSEDGDPRRLVMVVDLPEPSVADVTYTVSVTDSLLGAWVELARKVGEILDPCRKPEWVAECERRPLQRPRCPDRSRF